MRIQSLGQEDTLEEEMATQFQYSCLEDLGGLQSMGSQRVRYD